MSTTSRLLEVQALDLSSDQLIERRRTLPERDALLASLAHAAALDASHTALLEQRKVLHDAEHEVGVEVTDVASKAKEVENTLYSGSVKAAKELEALQEELRLLRGRQSGFEEREMQLLEEIDGVEGQMVENRAARQAAESDATDIRAAIGRAEGEIDAELADLALQCEAKRVGISAVILTEYDRLRTKDRLGGRAAAALTEGTCGVCRVRLPVVLYNRIRHEADDVLACCPRCLRVLVR